MVPSMQIYSGMGAAWGGSVRKTLAEASRPRHCGLHAAADWFQTERHSSIVFESVRARRPFAAVRPGVGASPSRLHAG